MAITYQGISEYEGCVLDSFIVEEESGWNWTTVGYAVVWPAASDWPHKIKVRDQAIVSVDAAAEVKMRFDKFIKSCGPVEATTKILAEAMKPTPGKRVTVLTTCEFRELHGREGIVYSNTHQYATVVFEDINCEDGCEMTQVQKSCLKVIDLANCLTGDLACMFCRRVGAASDLKLSVKDWTFRCAGCQGPTSMPPQKHTLHAADRRKSTYARIYPNTMGLWEGRRK